MILKLRFLRISRTKSRPRNVTSSFSCRFSGLRRPYHAKADVVYGLRAASKFYPAALRAEAGAGRRPRRANWGLQADHSKALSEMSSNVTPPAQKTTVAGCCPAPKQQGLFGFGRKVFRLRWQIFRLRMSAAKKCISEIDEWPKARFIGIMESC